MKSTVIHFVLFKLSSKPGVKLVKHLFIENLIRKTLKLRIDFYIYCQLDLFFKI